MYSLTKTISIQNSTISISFSISASGSGSTYIQTEIISYDYTAVESSFYNSYYISTLTVYYPNQEPARGNEAATVTAACVTVAIIVVIALLVVIFLKIRNMKQTKGKLKSDDVEQDNSESTNNFSKELIISNTEEDPLADDLNEEKFFNKI